MIKYNTVITDTNETLLKDIIENNDGKVIFTSDNSFIVSSVLNNLVELTNEDSDYNLYNGIREICCNGRSKNLIVTGKQVISDLDKSLIDDTYVVADFVQDDDSFFEFSVFIKSVTDYVTFSGSVDAGSNVITSKSTEKEASDPIEGAIKSNNIVFIQSIDDSAVSRIKKICKVVEVFDTVTDYTMAMLNDVYNDVECIVIKFPCPDFDVDVDQCKSLLKSYLSSGISVVCDTSWIVMFLEASCDGDFIDFTSTAIYNTDNLKVTGNQKIFDDYVEML